MVSVTGTPSNQVRCSHRTCSIPSTCMATKDVVGSSLGSSNVFHLIRTRDKRCWGGGTKRGRWWRRCTLNSQYQTSSLCRTWQPCWWDVSCAQRVSRLAMTHIEASLAIPLLLCTLSLLFFRAVSAFELPMGVQMQEALNVGVKDH